MPDWVHDEVIKRCKEQGIILDGKLLLVERYRPTLDGNVIPSYKLSRDKRWVCIPTRDVYGEEMHGCYGYYPECYEVEGRYSTYVGNGFMSVLTTIYVLVK